MLGVRSDPSVVTVSKAKQKDSVDGKVETYKILYPEYRLSFIRFRKLYEENRQL